MSSGQRLHEVRITLNNTDKRRRDAFDVLVESDGTNPRVTIAGCTSITDFLDVYAEQRLPGAPKNFAFFNVTSRRVESSTDLKTKFHALQQNTDVVLEPTFPVFVRCGGDALEISLARCYRSMTASDVLQELDKLGHRQRRADDAVYVVERAATNKRFDRETLKRMVRTLGSVGFACGDGRSLCVFSSAPFQLFCRTMTGNTVVLQASFENTILEVKEMIEAATDIRVDLQRITFAGEQLVDALTLADYYITSESTIYMFGRLLGDVGEWTPEPIQQEDLAALLQQAAWRGEETKPYYVRQLAILDAARCEKCIAFVECSLANSSDYDSKIVLERPELEALVGEKAVERLVEMGAEALLDYDRKKEKGSICFLLRRTLFRAGYTIPFHLDDSLAVVNVALNDDFEGAQLTFVRPDGTLESPPRPAGCATAHNRSAVHGVSVMHGERASRYGLFVIYH